MGNKYAERQQLPQVGTKFVTKPDLAPNTAGFFVAEKFFIATRRPYTVVEYCGFVPGAGGDLWWCEHVEDKAKSVYLATELDELLTLVDAEGGR